jgi:hypothetical protein
MEVDHLPSGTDLTSVRSCPPGLTREVAYLQEFAGTALLVVAQTGSAAGTTSTLGPVAIPQAAQAFAAVPAELDADDIYLSAIPLLSGKRQEFAAFAEELSGPRHHELLGQMKLAQHGEIAFVQHGDVDYVIPVVIGLRPWEDEHRAAPGDGEFNTWVNQHLADLHGVDFADAPPPANKLLWDVRLPGAQD